MVAGNQLLPDAAAPEQWETAGGRRARGWRKDRGSPDPGRGGGGGRSAVGRGSGGRWLLWPLRILAWGVLLLIGFRGVTAIIAGPATAGAPAAGPARQHGGTFPVQLAQAYALQFGQVYLNFNPATSGERARALGAFLPPGTDPQLGWNGAGTQTLQSEQVAGVSVRSAHAAVITLLARVSGKLIELGVPVYASAAGLAVAAEPALLPPPAGARPPQPAAPAGDPAAQSALSRQLPAFLQAFASGDQVTLGRFLAPGAQVTGLGGIATFHGISQLTVPAGGDVRHLTVTVVWQLPASASSNLASPVSNAAAQLEMTYAMTVVRLGGTWYVRSIGTSSVQPPPP